MICKQGYCQVGNCCEQFAQSGEPPSGAGPRCRRPASRPTPARYTATVTTSPVSSTTQIAVSSNDTSKPAKCSMVAPPRVDALGRKTRTSLQHHSEERPPATLLYKTLSPITRSAGPRTEPAGCSARISCFANEFPVPIFKFPIPFRNFPVRLNKFPVPSLRDFAKIIGQCQHVTGKIEAQLG